MAPHDGPQGSQDFQGARNARNIYIYIYVYAYVCVLCENVVARRDMGRLIVKTNSTIPNS